MQANLAFINLFRAIAAFWVLAAHCFIWGGWPDFPLPSAKIAVQVFMVISGYLMVANAVHREKVEPLVARANRSRFWLRRYFRIAPAYYLSLIALLVIGDFFLEGYQALRQLNASQWAFDFVYDPTRISYTAGNMLLHVTFLFGLHPTYSFSTFLPDWSLSLEMQFYLVFPVLFLLAARFGQLRTLLGACAVTIPAGFLISDKVCYYEPSLLVFNLHFFAAGMLLFHVGRLAGGWKRNLALGTFALLLTSIQTDGVTEPFVLPLLFLSMLVLHWIERGGYAAPMRGMADSIVVRFASDVSYAVYLFHGFFIAAFGHLLLAMPTMRSLALPSRVALMFLFVAVGSYSFGFLVHRLVEKPGIRFGKRLTDRLLTRR